MLKYRSLSDFVEGPTLGGGALTTVTRCQFRKTGSYVALKKYHKDRMSAAACQQASCTQAPLQAVQ